MSPINSAPTLAAPVANIAVPPLMTVRQISALSLLWFGISFAGTIAASLFPLTLRRLESDAFVIGLILAINPAMGIIFGPLAASWSDRVWTPLGRRAVFILVCVPVVGLSVVAIPYAPTLSALVVVFILNQIFYDALSGAFNPLIADLAPSRQRSFVAAIGLLAGTGGGWLVNKIGLPWVERYAVAQPDAPFGWPVYFYGGVFLTVVIVLATLNLREPKPAVLPTAERVSLLNYFNVLRLSPALGLLAIYTFIRGLLYGCLALNVLYATETLKLGVGELGVLLGWVSILTAAMILPYGWVDRRVSRRVLFLLLTAILGGVAVVNWRTTDVDVFKIAFVVFSAVLICEDLTRRTFIPDFFLPGRAGQCGSAVGVFHPIGLALGSILAGWVVQVGGGDYRLIWVLIGGCALTQFLLALRFHEPRTRDSSG